jgi:predicted nucleotidyltransferase
MAVKNKIRPVIKILKNLEDEIRRKYKAEIIGIFGSYARGEQRKGSDIDIIVEFDKGATLFDVVGLSLFLEEKLKIKKVDIVPKDAVREELKEEIFKEVVPL